MVAFAFVVLIAFIFVGLVSYENQKTNTSLSLPSLGLWQWLTQADWPSKVGAVLVIIGVGALLRYMMVFVNIPPEAKIGVGAFVALLLGASSFALRDHLGQRSVHTALAGAALATAYLTVYSANNFFAMLNHTNTFDMLVVICAFGAIFALRSNAISVAILSMFGAFMVPTFAFHGYVPVTLIGYYIALSLICMGIVWQTGWRSVMHLSVLFVLLGGLPVMGDLSMKLPVVMNQIDFATAGLVIALFLIVHAAMTLLLNKDENLGFADVWVIGLLSGAMAASYGHGQYEIGILFVVLASIWAIFSLMASSLQRKDLSHYVVVTVLCALVAVICCFPELSWSLWGTAALTLLLWQAPRLNMNRDRQDITCVGILMCGAMYIVSATDSWNYNAFFSLQALITHVATAALLLWAAWIGKQRGIVLATVLGWVGGLWAGCVIIHELVVMHLPAAVISLVGVIIGGLLVLAGEKRPSRPLWSFGMALMAMAAIKIVFFDFGSLGQLANILAVIGAGILFLGINWLAPYPPEEKPVDQVPPSKPSAVASAPSSAATKSAVITSSESSQKGVLGVIALVLSVLFAIVAFFMVLINSGSDEAWGAGLFLIILIPVLGFIGLLGLGFLIAAFANNQSKQGMTSLCVFGASLLLVILSLSGVFKHHEPAKPSIAAMTITPKSYGQQHAHRQPIPSSQPEISQQDQPAPPVMSSVPSMYAGRPLPLKGMTWRILPDSSPKDTQVHVGCANWLPDGGCDAYKGDTACTKTLPLLCLRPMPEGGVEINAKNIVTGTQLTSRTMADQICQRSLGKDWRMAEFHDSESGGGGTSGGWALLGKGTAIPSKQRFWVAIDDQRANCWDH